MNNRTENENRNEEIEINEKLDIIFYKNFYSKYYENYSIKEIELEWSKYKYIDGTFPNKYIFKKNIHFDWLFYKENNFDLIIENEEQALDHFINEGYKNNKIYTFDFNYYKQKNIQNLNLKDLTNEELLVHWYLFGKKQNYICCEMNLDNIKRLDEIKEKEYMKYLLYEEKKNKESIFKIENECLEIQSKMNKYILDLFKKKTNINEIVLLKFIEIKHKLKLQITNNIKNIYINNEIINEKENYNININFENQKINKINEMKLKNNEFNLSIISDINNKIKKEIDKDNEKLDIEINKFIKEKNKLILQNEEENLNKVIYNLIQEELKNFIFKLEQENETNSYIVNDNLKDNLKDKLENQEFETLVNKTKKNLENTINNFIVEKKKFYKNYIEGKINNNSDNSDSSDSSDYIEVLKTKFNNNLLENRKNILNKKYDSIIENLLEYNKNFIDKKKLLLHKEINYIKIDLEEKCHKYFTKKENYETIILNTDKFLNILEKKKEEFIKKNKLLYENKKNIILTNQELYLQNIQLYHEEKQNILKEYNLKDKNIEKHILEKKLEEEEYIKEIKKISNETNSLNIKKIEDDIKELELVKHKYDLNIQNEKKKLELTIINIEKQKKEFELEKELFKTNLINKKNIDIQNYILEKKNIDLEVQEKNKIYLEIKNNELELKNKYEENKLKYYKNLKNNLKSEFENYDLEFEKINKNVDFEKKKLEYDLLKKLNNDIENLYSFLEDNIKTENISDNIKQFVENYKYNFKLNLEKSEKEYNSKIENIFNTYTEKIKEEIEENNKCILIKNPLEEHIEKYTELTKKQIEKTNIELNVDIETIKNDYISKQNKTLLYKKEQIELFNETQLLEKNKLLLFKSNQELENYNFIIEENNLKKIKELGLLKEKIIENEKKITEEFTNINHIKINIENNINSIIENTIVNNKEYIDIDILKDIHNFDNFRLLEKKDNLHFNFDSIIENIKNIETKIQLENNTNSSSIIIKKDLDLLYKNYEIEIDNLNKLKSKNIKLELINNNLKELKNYLNNNKENSNFIEHFKNYITFENNINSNIKINNFNFSSFFKIKKKMNDLLIQYPNLFHKHIINDNIGIIDYKIIKEIKITKKNIAHIHCYDLSFFYSFFNKYLEELKINFDIIITFCLHKKDKDEDKNKDNKTIDIFKENFTFLQIENRGMDLGGKFIFLKYLEKNIIYSNQENNYCCNCIFFIHSKTDNKRREQYLNPFFKNKGYLKNIILKLENDDNLGAIFGNLVYSLEKNRNVYINLQKYNTTYLKELTQFLNIFKKNPIIFEGNIFIIKYSVLKPITDNIDILYSLLNNKESFDYNWFYHFYNKKNINIIDCYNEFKTKKLYGNNIPLMINKKKETFPDGMIEHTIERIWDGLLEKDNKKYLIM